ncbi:hypothetical protein BDV59DRAFT_202971 [Aspergillus ambiguus]|uniref:putative proline racemase n=1 Tax=Aspergillus ambiguus TaxID=176160 RepID=UPI003CCDB9D3
MDVAQSLQTTHSIHCIDMHTTGEPTRIIYAGYPQLAGTTLLSQRDDARQNHDHVRKRLMEEPRGHDGMYGAILRPETELVSAGVADIGVLFIHNEGYSTMCGHATLALGRFLVDTHDAAVFPRREQLAFDPQSQTVALNLHAPCGLVRVTVPVTADATKSDPSRPVSFLSTPAFASSLRLEVPVPTEVRWPELGGKELLVVDVSYGGAFYALVDVRELGFESLKAVDLDAVTRCIQRLKPYLMNRPEVAAAVQHPDDPRLSFLYSVMIVDPAVGFRPDNVSGAETGLCYFADNQIDRSPTGSCVAARMALAHAKGLRPVGQRWAYNSVVSNHFGAGAFTAEIVEEVSIDGMRGEPMQAVVVRVEGQAFYAGTATFMVEEGDPTSFSGFSMSGVI